MNFDLVRSFGGRKWRSGLVALLSLCWGVGHAAEQTPIEYKIWTYASEIQNVCKGELWLRGVVCIFVTRERAQSILSVAGDDKEVLRQIAGGHGYFSPETSDMSLADMLLYRRVPMYRAGVVIYPDEAPDNPPSAFLVTVRERVIEALTGWTLTDPDLPFVVSRIGKELPIAARGSEEEKTRAADFAARKAALADSAARLARLEAWHQSPEYNIITCFRQIVAARQEIEREQRVGRASGYENKRKLHQAGDTIVDCEDVIKAQWPRYRANGGTARDPAELSAQFQK